MTYAGTDLKFMINPQLEKVDLHGQDFGIIVKNRWGQIIYNINKDNCFEDEDGNFYFCLENVGNNVLYAYFKTWFSDDDYEKGLRTITDQQHLYTVGKCHQESAQDGNCNCKHHIVSYTQVWTVNVEGKSILVGADGAYILTKDGKTIEFKK